MNSKKLLVSLLLLATLAAALLLRAGRSLRERSETELDRSFEALGSFAAVTVIAEDDSTAAAILDSVETLVDSLETELSIYTEDGDGAMALLNRECHLGPEHPAASLLREILLSARELSLLTNGCFDPTLGRLVDAWGFPNSPAIPPDSAIEAALQRSGWGNVIFRDDGAIVLLEACQLNLGAVAKGFIVDRAWERAMELGALSALVEIGGEVRCGSAAGCDRTWRVAIRHPRGGSFLDVLEIPEGAVATSGDYELFFTGEDGRRYCHILDPGTGWPEQGIASATVVCRDAQTADALATSLCVGGTTLAETIPDSLYQLIVLIVLVEGDDLREVRYGG